jgi:hypothetical protein
MPEHTGIARRAATLTDFVLAEIWSRPGLDLLTDDVAA